MEIPDYLTCLLRNLYGGQEAIVRIRHVKTDWLKIGKGVCQGCILSACLFNLNAEYSQSSLLWPPDAKNWLTGKKPWERWRKIEKDWRQEKKGTTEDEMIGWHHRLDGHEFEQALKS